MTTTSSTHLPPGKATGKSAARPVTFTWDAKDPDTTYSLSYGPSAKFKNSYYIADAKDATFSNRQAWTSPPLTDNPTFVLTFEPGKPIKVEVTRKNAEQPVTLTWDAKDPDTTYSLSYDSSAKFKNSYYIADAKDATFSNRQGWTSPPLTDNTTFVLTTRRRDSTHTVKITVTVPPQQQP